MFVVWTVMMYKKNCKSWVVGSDYRTVVRHLTLTALLPTSMFSAEFVAPAFRGVLLLLLWLGCCLLLGDGLTIEVFGGLDLFHERNEFWNRVKERIKSLTVHLLVPTLWHSVQEDIDDLIVPESLVVGEWREIGNLQ